LCRSGCQPGGARTRAALEERTVIERAKGVIAHAENLPMDAAFDRLIALARDQARSLTVLAATVVDKAAATGQRLKS
jgi:AmiR/NasT family two-component response regulator